MDHRTEEGIANGATMEKIPADAYEEKTHSAAVQNKERKDEILTAINKLNYLIDATTVPGRSKSVALTKLDECRMWVEEAYSRLV